MLSIPEYFKGKNVFITGGTGFVGKALIEKLLRSCPDVGNIYLLIRNKRGKNIQERIKAITDCVIFDPLKEQNPSVLNKLIAIPGDIIKLKLGLSEEDEQLLRSKVDIIYHSAATVTFDMPLRGAVITNSRSAREMAQFALSCEHLSVMVHVSTMYSNCNRFEIDETLYPPVVAWKDIIELVEDEKSARAIEILTEKYIHPFPNTYTFTKKIAEEIFSDLCKDKVPLIIIRPSIVISAMKEPFIGWVDNLNGPFALAVTTLKGLVDVAYGKKDSVLDKAHIDNVIKATLIATWETEKENLDLTKPTIYNVCSDRLWKMEEYFLVCKEHLLWTVPLEDRLTFNNEANVTSYYAYYYIWLILFNIIPAIFLDLFMRAAGKTPMLLKVLRRYHIANSALFFFMNNTFTFYNKRYMNVEDGLLESDKDAFAFRKDIITDNNSAVGIKAVIGMKRYVLHEKWPIQPETYANTKKLYVFHYTVYWTKIFLVLYLLLWKWNILGLIYHKTYNYIESL